jgi:cytochrome P450
MSVATASATRAQRKLAPGPRYWTPFGFLRDMSPDILGFLERAHREYGDVVCMRPGPLKSYLLARPEHAKHVLVDNHKSYRKGIVFQNLRRVAGQGLILSEGELWKRQRRLVGPSFHRRRLAEMSPLMVDAIQDLVTRWEAERAGGEPFDVLPEMSKLALDVVCRAMFGTDMLDRAESFHAHVQEALEYSNYLINTFLVPPIWVPTRRNRRGRRTRNWIDGVIRDMIRSRSDSASEGGDLLSTMLAARDEETGEPMSESLLLDEMRTFLIAGHETTAVALAWTFYLLGRHPEAAERLQAEVDAALGASPPGFEDLPRLGYARRVIDESMRLYPPALATNRQALEDDEVDGWLIPRRANVTISIWVTHRHPEFWDEPRRFDPDRFLPERAEQRPRLAYLPFGAGPRRCIGEDFALTEATLALASISQRFRVERGSECGVEPKPLLTLRPAEPILVRIHPR